MRSLVIAATVIGLASFAAAQRGAAPGFAGGAHASGANHSIGGNNRGNFRRSSRSAYGPGHTAAYPGYGSLPFPFFADNFDPSDIYSTGYPVASEPPPFLMQALQGLVNPAANSMGPAMASSSREDSSSGPLMIELQNGRYVHVKSHEINGDAEPINFAENSKPSNPHATKTAARDSQQHDSQQREHQPDTQPTIAAAPLLPVTLIFRDGHSEEVRDYTIAQGTLYARGDYYTDGYWNKKIDLANINVQQTLQANATRNVTFVLPTSPNEVITRP
jgi:hypothetical protein